MKQLIIGIDGGTWDIFEKMPMPFLQSLMKAYKGPHLKIDMLSRGWAEQLTGKYADSTKAFYVYPEPNGSRKVIMKYSLKDMINAPEITPIWELAEKSGARAGVMNIPTTFPAPEVNGYFVSGAGGGMNKVDGIPPELCHPRDFVSDLEDSGYVIDLRLGTAGLQDVGQMFDLLEVMMEKRTESFIELSKQQQVDFGFLAYRALTVIQYLGMSELNALWFKRGLIEKSPGFEPSAAWLARAEPFYTKFDDCLRRVVETLAPEHLIFSSDHGIGETEYFFNPNALLMQAGFQPRVLRLKSSVMSSLRRARPNAVRETDWGRAKAFSDWYSSAIFINDSKRFSGPVKESEIDGTVDSICKYWNDFDKAKELGIRAVPYRREKAGTPYCDLCPDIKLEHDKAHFMASPAGPFMRENPNYGPVSGLHGVGGMHSGNKTPFPFFWADPRTVDLIREEDPKDLTLIYKLTERIFS